GGGAGEADVQHAQVGPAGRVAGVGAAAGGVLELVPRTRGGGLQRDGAAVQRLAVAGDGRQAVPAVDAVAAAGVGEHGAGDRVAAAVLGHRVGAPGQPGCAVQGVDDQPGLGGEPLEGLAGVGGAQQLRGEVGGLRGGESGSDGGQVDLGPGGAVGPAVGAVGGEVQDEVAAEDGQSAVG